MRVKKAIKKVAALVVGASMVGATILGASAAADLSTYPSLFIKDNKLDAIMVVGDGAAAQDVIGITDIATSLQIQEVTTSVGGTTTTGLEGDSWLVGSRGDVLELSDGSGNFNEDFDSQITRVSETELAALADGTTRTQKGTAPFEQFIRLDDGNVTFEKNTDTEVIADYIRYINNDAFINYSLEFTTSWESDIEDSSGAADATDVYLSDYEDESISLLGKAFTVLKARRYSATQAGIKLTLLGGDVTDTIEEGETKTYNVGGVEYEVENVIVTDSGTIYTQLRVNGHTTGKMQEDETQTLSDGTIIGVADILANEAGDVTGDLVRFYLGAQKIELEDSDISNTAADNGKFAINDGTVSDSTVRITGSNSSTTFKLDTIQIDLYSDDDIWVGAGEKLSKSATVDEDVSAALVALGIDIFYGGLTEEASNDIKLEAVSDDRYELKFKNADGNEIKLPLAYDNDSSTTALKNNDKARWGDTNDKLAILPNQFGIADDQYFILTDKVNSISAYTEVVQYKGSNKLTDSSPEAKFKLLSTGETVTRSVSSVTAGAQLTLNVGGNEYTFVNISDAGSNNFNLNITGGPSGKSHNSTVTENGALISFYPNGTTAGEHELVGYMTVSLVEVAKQTDSRAQPSIVNYTVTATSTDQKIVSTRQGDSIVVTSTDYDNDIRVGMNAYGLHVKDEKDSTNPRELVFSMPANQRTPQVYLTSGVTTTSPSTAGSTSKDIVRIDVGAAQLASTVRGSETSENLIIVGGPCANEAAAAVMGNPWVGGSATSDCADGFTDGEAMIKLYENGESVALLVAGYSAVDTRAAAQVVSKHELYDGLTGSSVTVSDTSAAKPTLSPMVAAAPVKG